MKKLISVFAVALGFWAFAAYATKTTYVKVAVVDDSEPDRQLLKSVSLVDLLALPLANIAFNPSTGLVIDAAGGADEVTIATASTTIVGAFKLTASTAPPVACAAGTEGTVYVDSDIHKICICNATAYVLANDDSTTTGCS
jgi:hypothetical protein